LRNNITISLEISMQQLSSKLTGITRRDRIFGKTDLEGGEE
jgi:hypothetical protein